MGGKNRSECVAGNALYGRIIGIALAGIFLMPPIAHAEQTKSWVVSWFTMATNSQENDCPLGLNARLDGIYEYALKQLGKSPEEIKGYLARFSGTTGGAEAEGIVINRGRIDGKPVNIYANPTTMADPHIHTVEGKYAFGFNLDGKGAASPNAFEDPETHEVGVNNQLARVTGCSQSFRGTPPHRPLVGGEYQWDTLRSSMPAWLISISGDDLSKDGDVTISIDRALEFAPVDANGDMRRDTTFRIDPSPRSHNSFRARIGNGVLTTVEPIEFHMLSDPYYIQEFVFRRAHLRLKLKADGSLDGILGGYTPWIAQYWGIASTGMGLECCDGLDTSGYYYALRRFADGYPDPKTGENTHISAAYRVEAIPALVVNPQGPSESAPKKVAQAPGAR